MRVVIRFGSRLSRFVSGSAAAHGAILALALVVPWTRGTKMPMENATVVALAGPIGGGAVAPPSSPAPPAPKPEPPAPAPTPKEAHTVKEIPPAPKEKPKPEPAVKKKETPKPEIAKPPAPNTAKAAEKPAPPGATGTGSGAGPKPGPGAATGITASVGGGDASLNWYGAAVKAALESAWQKPYLDDQTQVYSVVVAFEIAKDGTTRDVRVVEPSGVPSLDRSAVRAVMEASPLPAVPPSWTGDVVPVTMRFNLNPEGR